MHDLSLNFITSAKGHYGCKTIYQRTIEDLFSKSKIFQNCYKVAHIKVRPGEEQVFESMSKWLKDKDFEVIHTLKDWHHNDMSAQVGRLEDHHTILSHLAQTDIKFGFNLEDDFIFHNDIDGDTNKALSALSGQPQILSYRWSRIDDLEANKKSGCQLIHGYEDLYVHDLDWSFNPHFIRNIDHYYISRFSLLSYPQLHPQCEAAYRLSADRFKRIPKPFVLKYNQAVEHIGWESNAKKFIEEDNLKENTKYECTR